MATRLGMVARYFKELRGQIRYLADQWNFAADQRNGASYQPNINRITMES
jgi:hypothetical protein